MYASLVRLLEERELIRFGPFDASFCRNALLDDLDEDKITRFLVLARCGRNFPLPDDTPPYEVLAHLNLLDKGRPTNAAILLFGKKPQRFLITSEVKCAHFHGYEVEKPIPSYQAKDFILPKIDLWVGIRAKSTRVPTKYAIPQEVISEAIVNTIVHRDMIRRCRNTGLPEPEIRIDGGFFVLTIRRKQLELRAQSLQGRGSVTRQVGTQPESMEIRVLRQLVLQPMGKAQLSAAIEQKAISGHLKEKITLTGLAKFATRLFPVGTIINGNV
ncbi:MAG: hypothetical protein RAO75_05960 [Candidatus Chlorobium antarcticum]|nr:hypothetical protein [Candidatus Chlorobium antarcticum]